MTDAAWETLSNQAVAVAGVVYFLALLAHLLEWVSLRKVPVDARTEALVGAGAGAPVIAETAAEPRSPREHGAFLGRLGVLLTMIAAVVHLTAMVSRGMAADPNRVPWSNMYEFTLSGTFFVTFFYLVLYRKFALSWMAPLVVGFVLSTLMLAVVWLYDPVGPLAEALNSPWLVIHVVSAVLASAIFTLGGITLILYLIKERVGERESGYLARVPSTAVLDRLSYRLHALAFPLWTFGALITGPIWAHQAWSSYWQWDPKEVWAFITWVVYAAYLHARSTAGWKGRNAAYIALVGLATLWWSFIGINFFNSTSNHSYASMPAVVQVEPPPG